MHGIVVVAHVICDVTVPQCASLLVSVNQNPSCRGRESHLLDWQSSCKRKLAIRVKCWKSWELARGDLRTTCHITMALKAAIMSVLWLIFPAMREIRWCIEMAW